MCRRRKEVKEGLLKSVGLQPERPEPLLKRLIHVGQLLALLPVAADPVERVGRAAREEFEIWHQTEEVDCPAGRFSRSAVLDDRQEVVNLFVSVPDLADFSEVLHHLAHICAQRLGQAARARISDRL